MQACRLPAAIQGPAARHVPAAAPSKVVPQQRRQWRRAARAGRAAAAAAAAAPVAAEDKWIERALEVVAPDAASLPQPLANLHAGCLAALATQRMPTTRNEEYRFTDVSPLLQQALAGAPADVVSFALGAQSRARGGPFATLNGAAARDVLVVHIPANVTVPGPIHVLYLASGGSAAGSTPAAAPRLLAVLEEGSSADIVEEFAAIGGSSSSGAAGSAAAPAVSYLTNAVAEFELDDRAQLKHSYVELEGAGAAHMKATLVNQGRESSYTLTETRIGGSLSRHDLSIEQLGEATQSQMRSFLLCGDRQLHDLHSKLRLDHPNGEANQLHKCIVSAASGRGVFDGNVKVNRLAQKTDAQQLSRNLLLVPRAQVNVKPNLQIIADDVKCTHGCTVSDLEEEELFYLRARGISAEVARTMLVYSFGREVVQGLRDDALQGRVEAAVRDTLSAFAPSV